MTTARRGIPFVIAAPSGTGKTTVCRALDRRDGGVAFSVSHTTRRRREGERDGVDYHFVSRGEFEALVERGAFLEWAVYNGNRYGTSWGAIDASLREGCDVLLEIEVQGARQVRQRLDEARLIFLLPPSMRVLEERLRGRAADPAEEISCRLETARRELAAIREFDYAVFNDDLERCVQDVLEIVHRERSGDTAELRERFDPGAAEARFAAASDRGCSV